MVWLCHRLVRLLLIRQDCLPVSQFIDGRSGGKGGSQSLHVILRLALFALWFRQPSLEYVMGGVVKVVQGTTLPCATNVMLKLVVEPIHVALRLFRILFGEAVLIGML